MNAGTVIPVIAAPACVIYLVLVHRSMTMMPAGDEEWRQRWRQLDPARRKAVRDCMKRGDPVLDRGDAELSLRAVTQVEYVRKGIDHRTFSDGRLGRRAPVQRVSNAEPWVRAVIATPAQLEGLFRSSELAG